MTVFMYMKILEITSLSERLWPFEEGTCYVELGGCENIRCSVEIRRGASASYKYVRPYTMYALQGTFCKTHNSSPFTNYAFCVMVS